MSAPRTATLALHAHLDFYAALRALFGDVAQVSPAPAPAPDLDERSLADLREAASRLRAVEERLREPSKIPTTRHE